MADLLSILANGGSSLAAHQAAVATASHNLQNANTPGYARQRAELAANSAVFEGRAYIGRGVALQTVSQARDPFIEKQMPVATAAQARSSAESEALNSITTLDPDGAGSMTEALGDFFSSLRAMSQNPGDFGLRAAVVGSSRALALAFNGASADIETARSGLDAKLSGLVQDANSAASTIADLNRQIRIARSAGAEPNDLLDQRQAAADKLAELTGARPIANGNGDLDFALPGGASLVSGTLSATLSTAPDPTNLGHLALMLNKADGSPAVALSATATGGSLGGVLDARDGALRTALDSLDTLAFDFTNAINAVHTTGFGLDGASGRNLFTPAASASGAASSMAVNPVIQADPTLVGAAASAATVPGDASRLLALIGTESTPMSGGTDAGGTLATIISTFGNSARRAKSTSEQDKALLTNLSTQRESVSGVSIDEEMISLTKSQRAYEAVSKVIVAANDMLDTLMSLVGR